MSSLSRSGLIGLLLCCAAARNLVQARGADHPRGLDAPTLPGSLGADAGRDLPLGPSERALARAPAVFVVRRAYGATQVALVSTSGIRELHPPRVCLRSMGLEVVRQTERRSPRGCVRHLVVRDRNNHRAHFLHTYLGEDGRARCGFWGHTGAAVLSHLAGRPRRWSALQVMDRDPRRAGWVLDRLLERLDERSRP